MSFDFLNRETFQHDFNALIWSCPIKLEFLRTNNIGLISHALKNCKTFFITA